MTLQDSGERRLNERRNKRMGERYGRLVILEYHSRGKYRDLKYLCKCDCGKEKVIYLNSLRRGSTTSCGCYRKETTSENSTTHGLTDHRLYGVWIDMKRRCNNVKNSRYKNYGGRGIKVCEEWENNFELFYEWSMHNGYGKKLTIDRIDNDGDYEANNCRWSDMITQQNNTTRSRHITIDGETHTMAQWSRIKCLDQGVIKDRLNKLNWTVMEAINTPLQRQKNKGVQE